MKDSRLKTIIVLIIILAFTIAAAACGTKETAQSGAAEATDEKESDSAESSEFVASTVSVGLVPDGFTERDFDIGYSDYVTITLNGSAADANASGVSVSGNTVTITEAGNYLLTGELNGQIVIDVPGIDDKVQLILDNATITNETSAAIYVLSADKVFFTTTSGSENYIATTGSFVQTDENEVDGAIFSKDDIVFNGAGALTVECAEGHAIVSKDDLKITSGTYVLAASGKGLSANELIGIAGGDITINVDDDGMNTELDVHIYDGDIVIVATDDGIHGDSSVVVDGGTIDIQAAEGIEGTQVILNDGEISLWAYDDGINAAQKVTGLTPSIEINGGTLNISMAQGDTDALDSNGYLIVNGGYVNIEAQFAFDFEYGAELNGGTVIVNGSEVDTITNSMMGGWGGGWGGQGGGPGGFPGGRP